MLLVLLFRMKIILTIFIFYFTEIIGVISLNPQHIKFRFYTGSDTNSFQTIQLADLPNIVSNDNFNRLLKKTTIYIGDYGEAGNNSITLDVLQGYLSSKKYNVLQLIWHYYNSGTVDEANTNLRLLSPLIAEQIDRLVFQGVPAKNLLISGHSAGGQFSGIIGLSMINKPGLVVGMDVVGPGFPKWLPHISNNYLSDTSGQFVVILHTDAGELGTTFTDIDLVYIANSGKSPQPGCELLPTIADQHKCSHLRAPRISAAVLNEPSLFLSVKCDSYQQFTQDRSSCGIVIPVSPDSTSVHGMFYFNTSAVPPYGLGLNGII